jgi:hypothetical protein
MMRNIKEICISEVRDVSTGVVRGPEVYERFRAVVEIIRVHK